MDKGSIEVIRRVYDDNYGGVYVEVRPNPDAPEASVEIVVDDKKSVEYFGAVRLSLSRVQAKLLAVALDAWAREKPLNETTV